MKLFSEIVVLIVLVLSSYGTERKIYFDSGCYNIRFIVIVHNYPVYSIKQLKKTYVFSKILQYICTTMKDV